MAIVCALVSGMFSFFFSLVWHLLNGGSIGSFFLTYVILGNVLFVLLLGFCYLASAIRHQRHNRIFRLRLPVDRLV